MKDIHEDIDLVYVDGDSGLNMSSGDAVVLDLNLTEYPLAHEYVRQHELNHVRYGFLKEIYMEFKNDVFIRFSNSDTAKELDEYRDNNPIPMRNVYLNMLRMLWILPLEVVHVSYKTTLWLLDRYKKFSD